MDPAQELDLLCQNAVDVISKDELKARLETARREKRPLRVKAGFDPSAPDIHLGHTVLLRKLRQFQDLGHKVIFIIGDFTAMIGDPTGQNKMRPALGDKEILANAKTYQTQAFKILDKDPKKIEIVRNSDWLGKMSLPEFLRTVASQATVARILERDDFEKRIAENQPLSMLEILYPLFQGYDSVAVKSDVELGGTDQKFNLLVGRNLQKSFGQNQQIVMTLPLLVGLDGTQKMSKSLGNYIAVNDTPKDVFGKSMSIPDALMPLYFNLLTGENGDDIQKQIDGVGAHSCAPLHPRDAKVKLATLLTEFLHGKSAAEKESLEFDAVFKDKKTPQDMMQIEVTENPIWIVDLLKKASLSDSGANARRLLEQGAVEIDGVKVQDSKATVTLKNGSILKAGKRGFVKLIVKKSR